MNHNQAALDLFLSIARARNPFFSLIRHGRVLPIALFFLLYFFNGANATHINGADISYKWISGNTYELRLSLYRDCSGIAAPLNVSINYRSVSCGYNLNTTLSRIPGTGNEITFLCDQALSTCNGGTQPGIQKYEFTGNVTLPVQCSDWTFGYSICCRNCAITTLSYTPNNCTGVPATYIEATLNNLAGQNNSSPVFSNPPVSYFCIGQPFHYNHGAIDDDGDSLVYSFIPPRSSSTANVVFLPGYSPANPVTSSPPVTLEKDGEITVNPTSLEVGVMTMLVREFRNGQLIGSVVRDMEMWTHPCTNSLPTLSGINGTNNYDLYVCAGTPVNFSFNSTDADLNQNLTMSWSNPIPGSTLIKTHGSRPSGNFSWIPQANQTRWQPYTFTVTIRDNNCPVNGLQIFSFNIYVRPLQVNILSTNSNCSGSGSAITTVTGTGPFQYSWVPGGETSTSLHNILPGIYQVTVTDANGCSANASTQVFPATTITPAMSQVNLTCHGGNDGSISLNPSGGTPPYNYSWWPTGGNGPVARNLPAGTYSVVITDAHGCTTTSYATLTQPNQIQLNATSSTIRCNDSANGSISVNPSGGTAPYQIRWWNSSTSSTVSGLGAGTYGVTITDSRSCTVSGFASINQPPALNVSVAALPTHCFGINGSATVVASGGTGNYRFNWENSADTTSTITGLPSGAHSVTVTDSNGCSTTKSFIISSIGSPTIQIIATKKVSCPGGNDGEATLLVNGGQGPYTFQSTPPGIQSATPANLAAGMYLVTVTDAFNCSGTVSLVIESNPDLTVNSITVPANCGQANGVAQAFASGGIPPYTYSWIPGGNNSGVLQGLFAGSYTVVVTDAKHCTASTIAAVSNINGPPASLISTSPVSCRGKTDGSAEVSILGGIAPISINWYPTGGNATIADSLPAGAYSVTVADRLGCITTIPLTIGVEQPMSAYISVTPPSCHGINDGNALAFVQDGTAPYSYRWSSGDSTAFANGLRGGIHTITVTDARGCIQEFSEYMAEPPQLQIHTHTNPVHCNGGNDGVAIIIASGGTPGYWYHWSNGETNYSSSNLEAGSYVVEVSDAHGCTRDTIFQITQPPPMILTPTITNISCKGMQDGSASIHASGGSPPYFYEWGPTRATDTIISNLPVGQYLIKVEDNKGCSGKIILSVSEPDQLITSISTQHVSCYGRHDGSATALVSGGNFPYQYSWNTGSTNATATNLNRGTYSVLVTDEKNCMAQGTVNINEPDPMEVSILTPQPICIGQQATLNAQVSGGSPGFSFTWNNTMIGNPLTVNPSISSAYTLVVRDSSGCISQPVSVTVPVLPPLQTSIISPDTICEGTEFYISAEASGGNGGPYYFSWDNGRTGNTLSVFPSSTGLFSVTVSDGCGTPAATASTVVMVHPNPQVDFEHGPLNGCLPLTINFNDRSIPGGISYYWSFGDGVSDTSRNPVHVYVSPGTYAVNHMVTSAFGCVGKLFVPAAVEVYPLPSPSFRTVPEVASVYNPVVSLFDESINANEWRWDFGDGSKPVFTKNTEHSYRDTGYYRVKLSIMSNEGCVDSTFRQVLIKGEFAFYVPSAFTPNNDGVNDNFTALGIGVREFEMSIFDRWGLLLFSSDNIDKGWNGNNHNTGEPCVSDVYVYKIRLKDVLGNYRDYVGRVNLLH